MYDISVCMICTEYEYDPYICIRMYNTDIKFYKYTYMHNLQIQSLANYNSSPSVVAHIAHLLVLFPRQPMIEIHDRAHQLGNLCSNSATQLHI